MAPHLSLLGVELEVAYFLDRPGVKHLFENAGIRLHHISATGSFLNRLRSLAKLTYLLRQRRPDRVHTMVYEADILGRTAAALVRIPRMSSIISEMYGPEHTESSMAPWKLRLAECFDIATAQLVPVFHAVSQSVATSMAPRLRIQRKEVQVVYRGRDLAAFAVSSQRRAEARARLGLTADTPLILAIGRQEPAKGHDVLLEAMSRAVETIPAAQLLIAGSAGRSSPELATRIDELSLGGHVHTLGHRDDVADLLAAADVVAFPSRREGLGTSVIEALAAGCPVVCSDLPALREIANETGAHGLMAFTPVADPVAMASALVDRLTGQRDAEATNPAVDLSSFEVRAVAEQFAALYRHAAMR
jgi:glycosyltransferase involved in cell wall biosynthesis